MELPDPPAENATPLALVRAYHARTCHHFQRYARGPSDLDWASQPDPFRRYAGAELLALEHVPPEAGPLYREVFGEQRLAPAVLDRTSLSRLFEDALALSAWKQYGSSTWALRVNPSSGNLHPTEAHLVAPAIPGLSGEPFLAHYAPREHALERRARLPDETWCALELAEGEFLVVLSSIHWREAWKYGERAYRYCQHDVGHALACLAIAAAGLGWRVALLDDLGHGDLERLAQLANHGTAEREEPDLALLVATRPAGEASPRSIRVPAGFDGLRPAGWPNELSSEHVEWDVIEAVARAARKPSTRATYAGERSLTEPAPDPGLQASALALRPVLARRRSAVDFDGTSWMSRADFLRILRATLRFPARVLPWRPRAALVLFVHRVDGLAPGLYLLARDPEQVPLLQAACTRPFDWTRVEGGPEELALFELTRGDFRAHARSLSCHQDIAADGAFSLGMLAEFDPALERHGAWFYPRLFWECGAIGQVLYLEAEALGLRGTGIGCFFDEAVHQVLGIDSTRWRSLYHFTVGGPVEDTRLTTWPAYPPRDR